MINEQEVRDVYRPLEQAALVTPVRIALGLLGLAGAIALGLGAGHAAVEAAAGAVLTIFALVVPGGRRPPWRAPAPDQPEPLPTGAKVESRWRTLALGLFPSTYGVAILAAIALAFSGGLAAFLAGVLLGMGLLTSVHAWRVAAAQREVGGELYVERSLAARTFVSQP